MPRPAVRHTIALLLLLIPLGGVSAQQPAGDPIVPRGQVFFQLDASFQSVRSLYADGSDGRSPLGTGFFLSDIGSEEIPALVPIEARLRALAGDDSAPGVRLGGTTGRMYGEEQTASLRLSYGAIDRLTVGATIPFVRRRVDALVRHVPDGATVGANPSQAFPTEVAVFLSESMTATNQLRSAVDDRCAELGEEHPECLGGRSLVDEADLFLGALDDAYAQEALFPLSGSPLGALIEARWLSVRTGMESWETEGPEELPLPADPLDDAAFRALVAGQSWPDDGFPFENTPSFMELGDIELHAALALVRPSPGFSDRNDVRILSTVTGTLRLATGQADSLLAVAPLNPPRGVSGIQLGLVTDFLLNRRLAVLTAIEAGWNGSREMDLLAPDPSRLFSPEHVRARVRWEPGGHIAWSVTPRFHLQSALSIGAGWHYRRSEADRFESVDTSGPSLPAPSGPEQLHRLSLELRFTAMEGALAETVRFPFEIFVRGSRTISGSGDWAPVEGRVELGTRFLLRR